jgi:hypothetical protein
MKIFTNEREGGKICHKQQQKEDVYNQTEEGRRCAKKKKE